MAPALFGLLLAVPVVLYLDLQAERGLLVVLFGTALGLLAVLTSRLRDAYAQEHELLEKVSANEARHRSWSRCCRRSSTGPSSGTAPHRRELSPRVEAMLGFEHEDWVARGIAVVRPHPSRRPAEVLGPGADLARDRAARCSCDYRMVASDGRELWVRDEALVVDEQGRPRAARRHPRRHRPDARSGRAQGAVRGAGANRARADERAQRGRARDRLPARRHRRDAGRRDPHAHAQGRTLGVAARRGGGPASPTRSS